MKFADERRRIEEDREPADPSAAVNVTDTDNRELDCIFLQELDHAL